jgi:tRNA (mo5U34)-methyltransferase
MNFTQEELATISHSVPAWWHSIDLGQGVITPGWKSAEQLRNEVDALHLPDLSGKTVLDIGAFDGFFSFEAERRGARRVVALDHYAWFLDVVGFFAYFLACKERKEAPRPVQETPYWHPDTAPGKLGFDAARRALGSTVEPVIADFTKMDLASFGMFDVVLYLGVLYHMENPFEAVRRLAMVTKEFAIIESEAVAVPGYPDRCLWEFFPSNELNNDVSNWWAPNENALKGMCKAAGFRRVETIVQPPVPSSDEILRYRLYVHAFK